MQKFQIVCIGASTTYGVGGTKGGWPDLLKANLHLKMYGEENLGSIFEAYSLSVPGAVLANMTERTEMLLRDIRKPKRKVLTILEGGSNNAKAVDRLENFVSSSEEYHREVSGFLSLIKENSDLVICMGRPPMDQTKVMPYISSSGQKEYFANDRIAAFEKIVNQASVKLGIEFVPLYEKAEAINWTKEYQYKDGIHPNDEGHQWLYEQIKPKVWELIGL